MKLHKTTIGGSAALTISFALFLWFVRLADRAMDKGGVGDLPAWETLNIRAGIAFWVTVAVWLLLLGLGLWRHSERSQLFLVCGLSLLLAPMLWGLFVFVV